MKKFIILMLTLMLLVFPMTAMAEETEAVERKPGYCGEDITWELRYGVLILSGSGETDDFEKGKAPWQAYEEDIVSVVLKGSISYIGNYAFYNFDNITEVDLGESLHSLGEYVFYGCDGLTKVRLPDTFRRFGPSCFRGCKNLTEVYCMGGMPSFKDSCFWDPGVTVYHPDSVYWPEEEVTRLENNFSGRIEIALLGDKEAYAPNIPVGPDEEEPTKAPTEAPTAAPTEETAPMTIPTAPTREPEQTSPGGNGWIGLVLIVCVLSGVLLGMLLTRSAAARRQKGGKYSR